MTMMNGWLDGNFMSRKKRTCLFNGGLNLESEWGWGQPDVLFQSQFKML